MEFFNNSIYYDPSDFICKNDLRTRTFRTGFGKIDGKTTTFFGVSQGWPRHLSNLKTYLETGKGMNLPSMH
ncbi:hypothetical protein KHM19_00460 [Leptospira borgpetersenii]|uniref:Uncharacterized protein n=4 Tax=Leptospira borgpetersenii TaxID=174 RepID=M3GEM6_LEPBO|nr:hypothetical protein LEP1GSC128_3286 [Leptospira borgpetersenii str. 200801926]EKQ92212.1 hypothetical protein LEP1GSC101_3148 [Leptospira borgpetersenii str. UI 09149]EMF99391.1 hypothetical protein LEP1GSC123_4629 [Leptospira borgpetersenii str. 200701203]EMK13291.1 hypothetical protein LEP1GSC066_3795 [Leptospira sp. serovar Kenya str. Sh9]EMN13598.1 hypothetical protein LEP1GSC055_4006 [Leptospira borgpetersenii str. Brem 307]EMN19371.1 hypothetical protein LEP1GSC056_3068 [Leptospira b